MITIIETQCKHYFLGRGGFSTEQEVHLGGTQPCIVFNHVQRKPGHGIRPPRPGNLLQKMVGRLFFHGRQKFLIVFEDIADIQNGNAESGSIRTHCVALLSCGGRRGEEGGDQYDGGEQN